LAVLRNLRNMADSNVDEKLVKFAFRGLNTSRVLPFRFIAAARYAPQWEAELESAMYKSVEAVPKLAGKTVLVVDVSGSMTSPLSARSEMQRTDAAYGLAILLREIAEELGVYSFSDRCVRVPSRRGFALRDAIDSSQPHGSTYLGRALESLRESYDRLIVITDEQVHDTLPRQTAKAYMINVASYKIGVGYGDWTHIDGWSESVIGYIRELESIAQ
jgi:Mg-chelatase subunit ChlD